MSNDMTAYTDTASFSDLFNNMMDGFAVHEFIFDDHGKPVDYVFLAVNPAYEQMTGLLAKNVVGKRLLEVLPNIEPYWIETFGNVALTGVPTHYENYVNEIGRYYEVYAYSPKKGQFACLVRDITERKNLENQLVESKELFSLFMKYTPVYTYIKDVRPTESRVIQASDNFEQMVGVKGSLMVGKTMEELFPAEFASKITQDDWEVVTKGEVVEIDEELNGRKYVTIKFPIEKNNKNLLAGFTIDVTERKQGEEELRYTTTRLMLATRAGGVGVWDWDVEKNLMVWDDQMFALYGVSRDSVKEAYQVWQDSLHPEDRERGIIESQMALSGLKEFDTQFRVVWPDGSMHYIRGIADVLRGEDGRPIRMIGTNWDITAQKRDEEALKAAEGKFRSYIENSPDGVFVTDEKGNYVEVNPAAIRMTGYSENELLKMSIKDILPPESLEQGFYHFKRLEESGFTETEIRYLRKDGQRRWWFISAVKLSDTLTLAFTKDITDRKDAEEARARLEQQIQNTQKLESLGVLAGGIAHDFNNLLMSIIGNADLALLRLNRESPAIDNLKNIVKSADRAADLAKQMLAYSGKGRFVIERLDLNRLIDEMLNMLQVSISKKAVLRLNLSEMRPLVEADATQLRQVVMNLVINASEAIGDKSGVIAITTGFMECDRNYLKDVWLNENLKEGLYVSIEISDTGCGMDRETMGKVFDPFFTTKFTGRGLGMAAVLGIVRGHKGAIKVYSELKKGTTFKILMPAADGPAEFNEETDTEEAWKGSGTVLLVDDEESIRATGSEMLRALGYKPLVAEDGRHAVEVFSSRDDIDVVILDLTMPHMDGEQCFRELKRINPNVKVIISSGYNQQDVTQRFVGKGLAGFIQKPYRLSVLREALRNS